MPETDMPMNDLLLADFAPRPQLVVARHEARRAKFPAIDAHNHFGRTFPAMDAHGSLDWRTPDHSWTGPDVSTVLQALDACNIATIVNLDGMWGDELEANLDRYDRAYPDRFVTFAQSDWSLVTKPDFGARLARQFADSVRRGARGLKVWKPLGLHYRDADDRLIPIDDERLGDLWEAAAELHIPVLIHIADPVAFFQPLDRFNERWEELRHNPDWHFYGPRFSSFETLMEQFERLIAGHPRTTFIGAHVGCYAENLGWINRMMETYLNFNVDISARLAELGRQPYTAKRLFERHPDRIVFGLDATPAVNAYAPYFRFLETADEYFPYKAEGVGGQGRWHIYGIDLPDDTLRQIYHDTAARLLRLPTPADTRAPQPIGMQRRETPGDSVPKTHV
jgi:predicted TIM-barrel fold metal-dependent hydrolase